MFSWIIDIFKSYSKKNNAAPMSSKFFKLLSITNHTLFPTGDPCIKPEKIPRAASELTCKNGVLQGATKSTNGYVVIGIVQSNDTPAQNFAESTKQQCEDRKKTGYRYGMGKIFLNVASINPIGQ